MAIGSSSMCPYSMSTELANANFMNYMKPDNDFEEWRRDYQRKLDEEKANDPTTIFGWALKGLSGK